MNVAALEVAIVSALGASWEIARKPLGDGAGTRALIGVLLLHRRLPTASVIGGIGAALAAGT